jgi:FixJ family two-component response regulator
MIDLGIPELPGDQVAREMRRVDPCLATVLITGWNLEENDSRLLAFDFRIQKPFDNLDRVLNAVAQAVELRDTRVEESETA